MVFSYTKIKLATSTKISDFKQNNNISNQKINNEILTDTSTDTSVPSSSITRAVNTDFPLFPSGEGICIPDSDGPPAVGGGRGRRLPRLLNVLLNSRNILH